MVTVFQFSMLRPLINVHFGSAILHVSSIVTDFVVVAAGDIEAFIMLKRKTDRKVKLCPTSDTLFHTLKFCNV